MKNKKILILGLGVIFVTASFIYFRRNLLVKSASGRLRDYPLKILKQSKVELPPMPAPESIEIFHSISPKEVIKEIKEKVYEIEIEDHRSLMHGIDFLKIGTKTLLIFSSNGYPPEEPEDNWNHNIFYSWIEPENPVLGIHTLVSYNEAQEPASAAVSLKTGRILVTCEDGNNNYYQSAVLLNPDLSFVKSYPWTIFEGGHSGHVAALKNPEKGAFLVVFSEGWIDEGGVDGLGTGDDIWARIVYGNGTMAEEAIEVSVNPEMEYRDWWPLVAGSDNNWLIIWQRWEKGLQGAIITEDGEIIRRFQIMENIKYYYYDVIFLPSIKRYLVVGSREDGGFVSIIDTEGNLISTTSGLPNTIREAQTAFFEKEDLAYIVYLTFPSGAALVNVTGDKANLIKELSNSYQWDYVGTDGIFVNENKVLFATESIEGIKFITFEIKK